MGTLADELRHAWYLPPETPPPADQQRVLQFTPAATGRTSTCSCSLAACLLLSFPYLLCLFGNFRVLPAPIHKEGGDEGKWGV